MAQFSSNFTVEDVTSFLRENVPGISADVLSNIITQKIDGEILSELSDSEMREIAPLLGDRLKIKRVIKRKPTAIVSVQIASYM